MATHHHQQQQCHCLPTPTTTTATTCYCTMCYTTTPYRPPPPPPPPDPLIHSISSSHHHHHHHPQIHQYPPPQNHHNYYPPPPPPQTHQQNPQPENPTVSSLIHRIAALESTLRRRKHSPRSSSLRDAAARTIQTHFRSHLVRRSVTLRHLKDLAYIKSALNHLKSSVSNKTQFDSHTLSRESMSLLIKLDSIQGNDPMIRDGKRSISRELIRFMELIDEICTEKEVITVKSVRFGKNSKKSVNLHPEISVKPSSSRVFGYSETKFPETVQNQRKSENVIDESPRKPGVSQIGQAKVKKTVRFDENGNVYRLVKINHNGNSGSSDGSESGNGDEDEVEEIGVSSKETEDDSSEMSENEMDPRKKMGTRVYHASTRKNQADEEQEEEEEEEDDDGGGKEDDDSFVFSAPLPAKMEYRVDSAGKKQTAKH